MSHVFFTGFTRSTNYRRINKMNARIYQTSSLSKVTGGIEWRLDISVILREQKYALREIKELLEEYGNALFEMPPKGTELPHRRIIFCANILGLIRHLEKRTGLFFELKHRKESQKQYIENAPSQKERLVRERELTWSFMLKQDFYRPLRLALEQTRFTHQDFCRSVGVIHEIVMDIVLTQNTYSPTAAPKFSGEVECLPEHVECFQVFINVLR